MNTPPPPSSNPCQCQDSGAPTSCVLNQSGHTCITVFGLDLLTWLLFCFTITKSNLLLHLRLIYFSMSVPARDLMKPSTRICVLDIQYHSGSTFERIHRNNRLRHVEQQRCKSTVFPYSAVHSPNRIGYGVIRKCSKQLRIVHFLCGVPCKCHWRNIWFRTV